MSSPCHPWRVLFDSTSPFFLYFSFLSFSVYFLHNELFLELDNPIVVASLRYSAAEKSEGTLNSFTSFTGYLPNILTFGELNDSSVPFSFMIPSSDQDMDDVTLGEMLTAAHRGQVAQIRTLLEEQRQTIIAEYREKSQSSRTPCITQKKSADSYKDNYGDINWNFVKLINKVLQK